MKIAATIVAATLTTVPISAQAATVGQLDIIGSVNPSSSTYTPTGNVDFIGTGKAEFATGVFESVVTLDEALAGPGFAPTLFDLFDISFPTPGTIYQGGGFMFTATSFSDFDNALPGRGFTALGTLSGAFGSIPGMFSLSSQATNLDQTRVSFSSTTSVVPLPASVFMLLSAIGGLGGLGFLSRRREVSVA